MNKVLAVLFLSLCFSLSVRGEVKFDSYFENKSMRVDFALSGNSVSQTAAIMQMREEPLWGGPLNNLIDPFNYGGYMVKVFDKASGELIYSRGFNTLFEEWRTTLQAGEQTQSWSNSISFPYPKSDVVFEILARDKEDMQFHSLLKTDIDPKSIFIDRSPLKHHNITQIVNKGDSQNKVDIVFVAEGYTLEQQGKFVEDARRFARALSSIKPFDSVSEELNIWAVGVVSEESGTDVSGKGIFRNTALNSGYYTFGIDRYLTTPDMKSIRDAVWETPTDAIFILVNAETYGGGGMYNFYAMGTSDHARTLDVFVHEFGHSFAGLADEYFTSEVAYIDFYNLRYEPWEPNLTTLVDFNSKWQKDLKQGTPVPTPLSDEYKNGLGAFEGGGYLSKGIYRPYDHCMMRDYAPFCPVCSKAILQMVDYYCGK
jgi:hypothetical protein